ncbi:MAG: hypothetical protein R2763_08855 [Mycobacterium sp.]
MLAELGVRAGDLLQAAGPPGDLISRDEVVLSTLLRFSRLDVPIEAAP